MAEKVSETHICADVRWSECPGCDGNGTAPYTGGNPGDYNQEPHEECQGTGLRFWMLSQECPGYEDSWEEEDYDLAGENIGSVLVTKRNPCVGELRPHRFIEGFNEYCQQCGSNYVRDGRGRVAVDSLEAWLEAAEVIAVNTILRLHSVGYYFVMYVNEPPERHYAMAPTRLTAVQEALCKAAGAHEEGDRDGQ